MAAKEKENPETLKIAVMNANIIKKDVIIMSAVLIVLIAIRIVLEFLYYQI